MPQPDHAEPVLFRDAVLVTQNPDRQVLRGDVRIENGRIAALGDSVRVDGATIVDARGFAIVPGFINAHTHVAMSLLRGIADERDLTGFLEILFAVDTRRGEDDVEAGAAVGIAEMLLGGTTSFLDLYYAQDAVARAVEHLGIRGFLGWAVLDPSLSTQKGAPLQNARAFLGRWKGRDRVVPLVAPQGVYVCSEETWLGARDLARAESTFCHFHLSETRREVHEHEKKTGDRPTIWLDRIGFFEPGMVAAHGVWLTRQEIDTLARRGVGVAHCPCSNLKLATGGVAPVVDLRSAGVVVGLGTDSVASNNSLSMLREMHVAGLLQKHHRWDAGALPAQALLDLATIEGARLLGRESEIGSLEVGKAADFSLFNLRHPTMLPARPESVISHLAYSASEEAVHSVYVNGECVVRDRELVRASWETIRTKGESAAAGLWPEAVRA